MDWKILKSFFKDKTNTQIGGVVEGLDVFSIGDTLLNNPSMNIVYVIKNEDKLIITHPFSRIILLDNISLSLRRIKQCFSMMF